MLPCGFVDVAGIERERAFVVFSVFMGGSRGGDWAFWGYLAYSVAAIGYGVHEARRFEATLVELRACLARADKACSNAELEIARELRATDPRVSLGEAGVRVVMGELGRAEALAADVESREQGGEVTLDARARGDLLLVRGDLAAARNDRAKARSTYASAELLVGDKGLVELRTRRLDALDRTDQERASSELDTLQSDFSDLFDAAAAGKRDVMTLRAAKANDWLGRVTHDEARRRLTLAIQAAWKACSAVESRHPDDSFTVSREPPRPPIPGSYYYASRQAEYEYQLHQFERQKRKDDDRQSKHDDDAANTAAVALREGRELADGALQTLRGTESPLTDAGAPRIPAMFVVPGYPRARLVPGLTRLQMGNVE